MKGERPTVVHAYGVVERHAPAPATPGLGGATVTVAAVEGIGVLISTLPEEQYGAPVWRAHGEDPRWLERVAREHHAVLQAMAERCDLLPLRLPGIYEDLDTLRSVFAAQAAQFRVALEGLSGHQEWGVKVWRTAEADQEPDAPAPRSGREYLARRAAQAGSRDEARTRRQALLLELHEQLTQHATRAVANPLRDSALTGRREPMLLNGAYLVRREAAQAFLRLCDELAQQVRDHGMLLEVTGPWPPYNFAGLPEPTAGRNG